MPTGLKADLPRDDPLRHAPMLAGLPAAARSLLEASAEEVRLLAGDWLFRRGQPSSGLYVVLSGRVEVVLEEPDPVVIRVLGAGSTLGELSLLTGSTHSASVRARRDSEILRLRADDFLALLESEPALTRALLALLGTQLQASRSLGNDADPRPATIAIVPVAPDLPTLDVANAIAALMSRWRTTRLLTPAAAGPEPSRFPSFLDAAEREHDHVVMASPHPPDRDAWGTFCLRQADTVVVLARGAAGGGIPWARTPQALDVVLLQDHPPRGALAGWIDALQARRGTVVGSARASDPAMRAIARRLAGRSVGLVLSGGAARGLAHVGVIEELIASGIEIDRVGGTSMGATLGAMLALGHSPEAISEICAREFVGTRIASDYTLPLVALLRGGAARRFGDRTYGDHLVEELPREFFAVSCDLVSSELVVHRRGPLVDAVGASQAMPGLFPPMAVGGRCLVDGGVINNLPVDVMAVTGEGPVIASDVTRRFEPPAARRMRTPEHALRRLVLGLGAPIPFSIKDVMTRSLLLGTIDTAAAARTHADLVVTPRVSGIGTMAFEQLPAARAAGREAARRALDAAPEFVEQYAG
jgi:predicted acylesterase/phospholipase RssA